MTANNQSVLHFVDPIARFRDLGIVRDEKKRLAFFLHDPLKQFESAPGIFAVEIPRRFVGEDHARVVRERTRDGHALLFAAGKMAAGPFRFLPEADFIEEECRALEHFRFAQHIQTPHRDHDVFLRGKIFEEKMELEDESQELVSSSSQRVIDKMRDGFVLDCDPAAVRLIEQAEDVKERALPAAGRADDGVDGAALELERHAAERVDAIFVLAEIALDPFATERDFRFHEF